MERDSTDNSPGNVAVPAPIRMRYIPLPISLVISYRFSLLPPPPPPLAMLVFLSLPPLFGEIVPAIGLIARSLFVVMMMTIMLMRKRRWWRKEVLLLL